MHALTAHELATAHPFTGIVFVIASFLNITS
jgi:hypothetical protein